jgi:hypothetical protein
MSFFPRLISHRFALLSSTFLFFCHCALWLLLPASTHPKSKIIKVRYNVTAIALVHKLGDFFCFLGGVGRREVPATATTLLMPPSPSPEAVDEKLSTAAASNDSDGDTPDSDNYEHGREELRVSNPQGMTSSRQGVDVKQAEQDFSELSRQFSSISHQARHISKQASRASKTGTKNEDVEKSASSADSEEQWDLETALRGNRAAEVEAGIRDKHIGVYYKDKT